MTPWPDALRKHYPTRPDQVPERPWWTKSVETGRMVLLRGQFKSAIRVEWHEAKPEYRPQPGAPAVTPARPGDASVTFQASESGDPFVVKYGRREGSAKDTTTSMDTEADLMKLLEQIDREHPLPHPGYRTGQVWGHAIQKEFTTLQLVEDYDGGGTDPVHPAGRWFTAICGSERRLSESLGDRRPIHVREERMAELLAGWVLIADAACPWLAPWGGQ